MKTTDENLLIEQAREKLRLMGSDDIQTDIDTEYCEQTGFKFDNNEVKPKLELLLSEEAKESTIKAFDFIKEHLPQA